jgi:hypothetical protein
MKSYYYVYKYGDRGPRVRHPSFKLAVAEAERLATVHVGQAFEVLQAVAVSSVKKPAYTFYMDEVIPPEDD